MAVHNQLKKSLTTLGVLGVLAVAGSFAWTSFSQRALNEASGSSQPGGRVHDDYEGFDRLNIPGVNQVNKDVYAENYSDQPIFVRIKLTEYLEIGKGAGKYIVDTTNGNQMTKDPTNLAVPLVAGTSINAIDQWPVYKASNTAAFRQYVTWELGQTGEKVYLPTFNQNNQNIESDVTGQGIETATWTTNQQVGGTHDQWTLGQQVDGTLRTYDTNSQTESTVPATHTAKLTETPLAGTGGYMTMNQWNVNPILGNFWVHDGTGWLYWANPLPPHTATSTVLNSLTVNNFVAEDMYYAINVISDFADAKDVDTWVMSTNAKALIKKAKATLQ